MFSSATLLALLLAGQLAKANSHVAQITVNAHNIVGQLKNLQGTNNCDVPNSNDQNDAINDTDPLVQKHWKETGVKHVMIYTFPDVFLGLDKTGEDGDAWNFENYNFTDADERVRFVIDGGAMASGQFQESASFSAGNFSEDIFEGIGFMITDRYVNGAHNSGFKNAIELWDFYPERDNVYAVGYEEEYVQDLKYYAAFARGVAKANNETVGCSAWGFQRMWTPTANYTRPDPWKTQFFQDIVEQDIPIKAVTIHWDNPQFNWDPYELVSSTKQFRELYLTPVGLDHVPIWITEHNYNPLGLLPNTAATTAFYNDPATFAGWVTAANIYGQDADAAQVMPWPGVGYGGYGYGPTWFNAWYNKTEDGDVALNAAEAWALSGKLVTQTPQRLALDGSSSNGFAAVAGISDAKDSVQILLNNYQANYDLLREFAQEALSYADPDGMASPLIQDNGLLNGEQFAEGNYALGGIEGILTFTQAVIRNNTATGYKLVVNSLPWSKFLVVVERVGGGSGSRTYYKKTYSGNQLTLNLDFPANAQDLVTITKA